MFVYTYMSTSACTQNVITITYIKNKTVMRVFAVIMQK